MTRDGRRAARERGGEAAAGGASPEFEGLVREYRDLVYNLSYRLLGDAGAAEDLTQEVFLRVYSGLGRFRGESSHKTWIYRITLNAASSVRKGWARRARRRHVALHEATAGGGLPPREILADSAPDPERIAVSSQLGERLQAALDLLPEEFREAVVLRDVEGLSYREIAEATEVAVGTVKSRIARGRSLLREQLEEFAEPGAGTG